MKILKITLTLLLVLSVSLTMSAQNNKRVLLEEFTNASCGPCASQNPAFQILLGDNESKAVGIKWQTEFPGYDPMNVNNAAEIETRLNYYPDLTGVPTSAMNGFLPTPSYGGGGIGTWASDYPGAPYGYNQDVIDNEYELTTPLSMVMTHTINDDLDMVDVSLVITNDGTTDFSLAQGKVHVVLLEKEILFASAPGSNGEKEFFDIVIKMLTGSTGQTMPTLAAGASHTVVLSEALPAYVYDERELRVAAFVQDDTDKAVYQSTITDPMVITVPFTDLTIASATQAPANLCGALLAPTVSVINGGTTDITEFNTSYIMNGGTPVTLNWTGTLAAGASESIAFPEIVLGEIQNTISFSVDIVGDIDLVLANNGTADEIFLSLSEIPIGTAYSESNESYANNIHPAIAAVRTPYHENFIVYSRAEIQNPPGAIGGFGNSEKSILVNFYNWESGIASMTYDKISLVGVNGATLGFDRAYAQYQAENDKLAISVSTDCGDNWTEVYSKQGNDLETASATQVFFAPAADEWIADLIDLSAYDGADEMIVRFTATTDYGNSLYLDNINLYSAVSNQNLSTLEGINVAVTPNPAVDNATINIELDRSLEMDIAIYDMSGKLVRNLARGQDFAEGTSTIAWDLRSNEGAAVANGLYMVRIMSTEGQATSRVMIAK